MSGQKQDSPTPVSPDEDLLKEFETPTVEQWRAEVDRLLKGAPYDKKMLTPTPEGITLRPQYRHEDIRDVMHLNAPPGFAPYVRGIYGLGTRQKGWSIAQEINCPTYEEFNSSLRYDMTRGLTAVNLPLDHASRHGLDPDQAEVGEVGFGGVSIASITGMAAALDGVDLSGYPIIIQPGTSGLAYLGFLIAAARKRNIATKDLAGAIAMDPIGELVAEGSLPISLESMLDEMALMTTWAENESCALGTAWIHGERYGDGGASAVQELAFAVAGGLEYLRAMESRSVSLDAIASRIRFSFSLGGNFFMEVAKLRAARLLWYRITESCGVSEEHRKMWIHARTARYTKTTYDPYVNMLRTTTEAFSGVVGGANSLQVGPFDEHMRPGDEFSRRIARNTQIILRDESHMANLMDPAGGSYYVERLTADLAESAWTLFQETEKRGGLIAALHDGFPQKQVTGTARKRSSDVAARKQRIVGTNMYPNASEKPLKNRTVDLVDLHARRSAKLRELRTSSSHKDEIAVLANLADLLNAEPGKVVETIIACAEHGATVGEIYRTIRSDKSDQTAIKPIVPHRAAEAFEHLRRTVSEYREHKGPARVFLATLGPIGKYMPRFDFAASFFEVGGFEVARTTGFDSAATAAENALTSDPKVVVICGPDDAYVDGAPEVARAVKKARPGTIVVLAGAPATDELKQSFTEAGVDLFIHMKSNALETLTDVASRAGVLS